LRDQPGHEPASLETLEHLHSRLGMCQRAFDLIARAYEARMGEPVSAASRAPLTLKGGNAAGAAVALIFGLDHAEKAVALLLRQIQERGDASAPGPRQRARSESDRLGR
jgi:hypothetical protein